MNGRQTETCILYLSYHGSVLDTMRICRCPRTSGLPLPPRWAGLCPRLYTTGDVDKLPEF
jgi:hypothetical protein